MKKNLSYNFSLRIVGYQLRFMAKQKKSIIYFIFLNFIRFSRRKKIAVKLYLVEKNQTFLKSKSNENIKNIFFQDHIDYKYIDNFLPLALKENLFPHLIVTLNYKNPISNENLQTKFLESKLINVDSIFKKLDLRYIFNKKKLIILIAEIYYYIGYEIYSKFIKKCNSNIYLGDLVLPLNASILNIIPRKLLSHSINSPNLFDFEWFYLIKPNIKSKFKLAIFDIKIKNKEIKKIFKRKTSYFSLQNNFKGKSSKKKDSNLNYLFISQPYEYSKIIKNIFYRLKDLLVILALLNFFRILNHKDKKKLFFRPHPRENKYDLKFFFIRCYLYIFKMHNVAITNPNEKLIMNQLEETDVLIGRDSTVIISYINLNKGKVLITNNSFYQSFFKKNISNISFISLNSSLKFLYKSFPY